MKQWKRRRALLWAILLTVSLVLGGCGDAESGAVQSIGESLLDSIAADMGEDSLESVETEFGEAIGREIEEGLAEAALGDETPEEKQAEETISRSEPGQAEETVSQSEPEQADEKTSQGEPGQEPSENALGLSSEGGISVEPEGEYSDRDHVALYIHLYGELPSNYITKEEARALGWDSSKGNLWEAAPGKSIGGDVFGNREGLLPKKKGRRYYECDINYEGGYRGGERIVFSDDGLVYYSEDHYENFELLYNGEGMAE